MWRGKPHVSTIDAIAMCDDESATTDLGDSFEAYVKTRAYQLGGLLNKAATECAVLEADPSAATTVKLTLIKDYGVESRSVTVSLAPTAADGSATPIIRPIDDAYLSEAHTIQFKIGDDGAVDAPAWQLQQLAVRWKLEGRSA